MHRFSVIGFLEVKDVMSFRLRDLKAGVNGCLLGCLILAGCGTGDVALDMSGYGAVDTANSANGQETLALPQRELDFGEEIELLSVNLNRLQDKPANAESVIRGFEAFQKRNFVEANFYIQHALKFDPQNPHLHKLNAISYHLRGDQGDPQQYELAEVGYQLASQMDPGDSTIPYFEGVLNFTQRRFKSAQDLFARAIIIEADIAEYYVGLAAASYYLGETERAYININKARALAPNDEEYIRASGIIHASMGAFGKAESDVQLLTVAGGSSFSKNRHLVKRILDWKNYFKSSGIAKDHLFRTLVAQNTDIFGVPSDGIFADISDTTSDGMDLTSGDDTPSPSAVGSTDPDTGDGMVPKKPVKPNMALIDVAIIRTEEIYKSSKGVNLLDGLNILFTKAVDQNNIQMQLGATGSGLAYSLNIFNDNYDRNEIIARPTIVVQDNEVSTFFSGGTMHVVLEGGQAGSGSIEPIDDGVKLKVIPKFLSPDLINIAVSAERTSLETSLASVSDKLTGTSFARTSKTKISANLTLEYGQTMVLSGLSDQFKDNVDSKVPGLGDVPVAQYLFRNKTTVSQNRTVLILLTPRRASLTFEDGTPIQAEVSVSTANLKSLEKNARWMVPSSNLQAIVSHLSRYQFFNQYRKGDIMLDTWTSESWKSDALEKALEYFYIRYDFATGAPELSTRLN